jgi:uncharacterized protein involved in exopolysaccharide biosynthesis
LKFSELQDQLKENFGIDHLADIARELGVSPQAVSNWKARDRVPYKYVLKIRGKLEASDTQLSGQSKNNASDSNQVLPQYDYSQHFEEDTITLTDILLVLARQLKVIIITPSIICTIAIIYALFFTSPIYESTAKIMSSSRSGQSQINGLASQFGINLGSGQTESQWVYPEIIKSRTLARTMLKRKFDTIEYGPQKPLLQILTYGNQKKPTKDLDTIYKTGVNGVIGMIDIQQNGSFYNLTISASEPVFARDFAVALIEELDAHQREYNKAKTSEARQFIEERIIDTEMELQGAEEALKNFRDRNRRIENSPALLLEQQRLSREETVLTGVFTTLKQQLETTKIEQVKDIDYVVVLDPPEAPLYRSGPRKKRMVILAGLIGIFFGMVLAFVKEYVDDNDDEDENNLGEIKSLILQNIKDIIPFKRGVGKKN